MMNEQYDAERLARLPNPLEEHTAESKWQFCNCQTCQEKRIKLDGMPGPKIDYNTFRLKDERY